MSADASQVSITIETDVDEETAAQYYVLYRETFGELETRAVARQTLHEHEFVEEMHDPRVLKYVARTEAGEAVGMSTFTSHLETVPWISPAYFAHHFPEHTARGAVYYLGFTLVHREWRKTQIFAAMLGRMIERAVEERAVVGWDLCMHNDQELGFGAAIERMLHASAEVTVAAVDHQTYYTGSFQGGLAR